MSWFNNLKIGPKLYITFAVILLLTMVLGVFSVVKISRENGVISHLADGQIAGIRATAELEAMVGSFRRGELLVSLVQEAAVKDKYVKRMAEDLEKIKNQQAICEKFIDSDEERRSYDDFKTAWSAYVQQNPKVIELALQNKVAEVDAFLRGDSSKYFNQAIAALRTNQDAQIKVAHDISKDIYKSNLSACLWIGVSLVVCTLIGLIFSVAAARNISGPIRKLAQQVSLVSEGDLTCKMDHCSNDETGQLSRAFNAMVSEVQHSVAQSVDSSNGTAAASRELSQIAGALTDTVQRQSTMIEESNILTQDVADSLDVTEDMAISTTETIEETRKTLARFVKDLNDAGSIIIKESDSQEAMVGETRLLAAKATDIRQVLEIISDIADQTNLLALNASIEAARAGEAGRGFAVVADEVRALAAKTQSSLAQINTSVQAVVSGVEHVCGANEQSAARMRDIAEETRRLISNVGETDERLKGAVDISSTLVNKSTYIATRTKQLIDKMQQIIVLSAQSSSVATEVGGVAASLAEKSACLRGVLSKFRV